jgi:hypothetical protein
MSARGQAETIQQVRGHGSFFQLLTFSAAVEGAENDVAFKFELPAPSADVS